MAKGIYVGVGGIARKVNKEYVGVGGVARKVTKGYVGVGGIARECYSSGVTWKKYACNTTGYYTRQPSDQTTEHRGGNYNVRYGGYYTSYTFSDQTGFLGSGDVFHTLTAETTVDELNSILAGTYCVNSDSKYKVVEVYELNHSTAYGFTYRSTVTEAEVAERIITNYYKGSYQDTIEVPEGMLPENGTLVDGSVEGDYCVLEVLDGFYQFFYYEKV